MKILLTGSSGLLGRHLEFEADRPSHQELDITKPMWRKNYDLIVHCAAYTNVELAELDLEERKKCFEINVTGTFNLLNLYPETPFVFISSEYAHKPELFYSWTKSVGEQMMTMHKAPYLIIRTLFKPYPWPYPKAFNDQFTMGDYVTYIAPKIEEEINNWDRKSKMIYVGTGRKTMYDIALETNPSVIPNSIKEMKIKLPSDYK